MNSVIKESAARNTIAILNNADIYQFTKDCRSVICPCRLYGFKHCLISLVKKYSNLPILEHMNTAVNSGNHLCSEIKVSDWESVINAINNFVPLEYSLELKDKILDREEYNKDTDAQAYLDKLRRKYEPYY